MQIQEKRRLVGVGYLAGAVKQINTMDAWIEENFPAYIEAAKSARRVAKNTRIDMRTQNKFAELFKASPKKIYPHVFLASDSLWLLVEALYLTSHGDHTVRREIFLRSFVDDSIGSPWSRPRVEIETALSNFRRYNEIYEKIANLHGELNLLEGKITDFSFRR